MQFSLTHIPSNTDFYEYAKDHPLTFYAEGAAGELIAERFNPETVDPFVRADGQLGFQDLTADRYEQDIVLYFMPTTDWAVVVTDMGPVDHITRGSTVPTSTVPTSTTATPSSGLSLLDRFKLQQRPSLPWNNGAPALGWATCIHTQRYLPDEPCDADSASRMTSQLLQQLQDAIVSCCQNALLPYHYITEITVAWVTPKDAANPAPEEGAWAFVYLK